MCFCRFNWQAWRDERGGPKLAVVANDDERLHVTLENLGLLPYFDFVLTSREVWYIRGRLVSRLGGWEVFCCIFTICN